MGQSSSHPPPITPPPLHNNNNNNNNININININFSDEAIDHTYKLPDDCLSLIFHSLTSLDRKHCSLVSKRWLTVEAQSRHRLTLNPHSDLFPTIPSLFKRYSSVTKLSLRCDRKFTLNDDALTLISQYTPNLTRVKLRSCRDVTDLGLTALGVNCKQLKSFSCGSCLFGVKGVYCLVKSCFLLEEISVKRLRGTDDDFSDMGIGFDGNLLRSIVLKELYNVKMFGPLVSGSKRLKTLKVIRCLGDCDRLLESVSGSLEEVHLERVQVSDIGLRALAKCEKLEVLHMIKTVDCSNVGVVEVAERCKLLRKVHIDGWKTNRIGNEALSAIGKCSMNLQELVLIGVNPGLVSLEAIAMNCKRLERLALCGSETIADGEIACIAEKCVALKKVCIKRCPVSDEGIEAFGFGCPNLVKIKVKKCRNVTGEVGEWLRLKRGSLVVNLDACAVKVENVDASMSESGRQEEAVEFSATMNQESLAASASGRGSIFRTRFGRFGGRGFVTSTFRRWSAGNSSSNGNL